MTTPNPTSPAEDLLSPDESDTLPKPNPSPFVRILFLVLIAVGSAVSGICPDLLSASVFAAITAGLFSYTFLLTYSPIPFTILPFPVIAAWVMTGSFYHALQALLFLPLAVTIALCLLRVRDKTQTVIHGAAAIGAAVAVLFLITYMMQHGTIAPQALKQSYNDYFAQMQEQMTDSVLGAYDAMEAAAQTTDDSAYAQHPILGADTAETDATSADTTDAEQERAAVEAYLRSAVELSVNSVKLAFPALFAIGAQVLAYLALSLYAVLTKWCHTPYLLPLGYRITVSRTAAVIFVIAYLINLFPIGGSISLTQIASANLATMLMPGIFLMGLNSLKRRAKDPGRRVSFIITAVVIGFLVFVYPSYAVFFVLIDGIGEVFFGGRSIF